MPFALSRVAAVSLLASAAVASLAAEGPTDPLSSAYAAQAAPADGACTPPPAGAALTLAQVRLDALRCNRTILAARRGVEASQADVQIASQRPNPVLSLGVENINPHAGVGAGNLRSKTVDSTLRVDQLIETANKGNLRVDAARKASAAAGEVVQAVVAQQTGMVEQAYFDALASQERVAVLREMLGLYERTRQASETRLRAGDVARAEVTRLQLDALRAQNDLRQAITDHYRDKAMLAQAMGVPGTLADNRLVADWPALDAAVPPPDPDTLQRRPDVTAAEARLAAAGASRDLARAGRVPDVTIGAQAEHYPTSPSNSYGSGNSFGVFLSIPLPVRHSNGGQARRAEVDYYAALDDRNRVMLEAGNEIDRLRSQLETARQSLRQMREEVLPAAESVAGNAEFAYGKGASGVLDLLDARRALRQTRLDAVAVQDEYAKALSAYRAALQTSTTAAPAPTAATAPRP
ncbi:TolC family protein [Cupriavidus taiwanensis]|uniref:Putative outer membrane efflux protein n=5 Tax=Cupriavidus taiwanensis TaxID=164546 RepID=A0A375IM75_9BURK|nr:TolC family protein [Cupriavidus taiwanensis]SOY70554.1 putative outer membrane efflux protein [Cupriavidus taiwanensis]SOY72174.1 putative outer membrane efflux protein [Cupriavidus taiwanensis]SOY95740.1 putative outer membrane efflux protein [Cupriavidus taiwanensis]SOZ30070.1 putative outer membrane efflux protein [Cupriavidus taiwanensis]SOZ74943.1 putative outer membrane efflux protein [Cupriavidus taiwanensis]